MGNVTKWIVTLARSFGDKVHSWSGFAGFWIQLWREFLAAWLWNMIYGKWGANDTLEWHVNGAQKHCTSSMCYRCSKLKLLELFDLYEEHLTNSMKYTPGELSNAKWSSTSNKWSIMMKEPSIAYPSESEYNRPIYDVPASTSRGQRDWDLPGRRSERLSW
jgi:hypothetical protein